MLDKFTLSILQRGKNSILFKNEMNHVLYEKLTNSIHSGESDELINLVDKIERVEYKPLFESDSLKNSDKGLESIILNVSDSCDLRCEYCIFSGEYEGERVHGNYKMNKETAFKALDILVPKSKSDTILIGFYGGEPLTNFSLIKDVVNYSRKKFNKPLVFSLTSNFFNANKFIDFLVGENFYINASVDGPKEIHDKQRFTKNGSKTYDIIMRNIDLLDTKSPGYVKEHVGLNATSTNKEDFLTIVDEFISIDSHFTNLRVSVAETKGIKSMTSKSNIYSEIFNLSDLYVSYFKNEQIPPKVLTNLFYDAIKFTINRNKDTLPSTTMLVGSCYPGNHKVFVNTAGDFYMCEKFGERLKIGSDKEGINDLYVDESINKFINIRNELCVDSGCWAQKLCAPCMYHAKDTKDISSNGLKQYCESLKFNVILGLSLYERLVNINSELFEKQYLNNAEV